MAKNTHIIEVKTIGSKNAIKAVAAVTAGLYAFAKAVGVATDLAKQSAKVDALERGFDALGSKIGFTSGSLDKLRGAVDGTVNDMDLMKAANNAMMLGVVKTDDEMSQLFDTAQRLGQALGVETTDALNSMVTGMGRQSKLMLDNLGIIVDADTAYTNYAEKLGIATSELDDLQKKEAFNEEVLRISNEMVGDLGDEVLDGVTAFAQLEASIFNARTAIGEALSPVMQDLARFFKATADEVARFMTGLTQTPFETTIKEMKALGMETTEYELALNRINQDELIQKMAQDYQQVLEPIDLINRSVQEKKDLLDEEAQIRQELEEAGQGEAELYRENLRTNFDTLDLVTKAKLERLEQIESEKEFADANRVIAEQQIQDQVALNKLTKEETELNKTNFNILDNTGKKKSEILKEDTKAAKMRKIIMEQGSKAEDNIQKKLESSSEFKKAEHIKDAIRIAAKAAVSAYEWGTGWGGPIAGSIAGAIAFAAAGALAGKVSALATGGDFITSGPQLLMVGDNPSGQERVQVTPLGGDPNLYGPQGGGGITLNISGNVLHESFVEDNIIPQIREGIRLGENIGL